jgi:hypothetical protein
MRLLLDPRPKKRPSAGQVLGSSWMRSIEAPHGGRVEQWCSGSNS